MSNAVNPVSIRILDSEYRFGCSDEERESLLASARYLDEKMREIRRTGRVIGTERIAVMAALNIAHELLSLQGSRDEQVDLVGRRLRDLQDRIELALNSTNQLEL